MSEVVCSHILVKHAGSRRAASWRQDKITRSKQQAIDILKGILFCLFIHSVNKVIIYYNSYWKIFVQLNSLKGLNFLHFASTRYFLYKCRNLKLQSRVD